MILTHPPNVYLIKTAKLLPSLWALPLPWPWAPPPPWLSPWPCERLHWMSASKKAKQLNHQKFHGWNMVKYPSLIYPNCFSNHVESTSLASRSHWSLHGSWGSWSSHHRTQQDGKTIPELTRNRAPRWITMNPFKWQKWSKHGQHHNFPWNISTNHHMTCNEYPKYPKEKTNLYIYIIMAPIQLHSHIWVCLKMLCTPKPNG